MFDAKLHPISRQIADYVAGPFHHLGVRAAHITWAGFILGLLCLPLLSYGLALPALGLILLNRLADGLDGALARRQKPSAHGAFLDITLDFIFYSAVPLGFALANPSANALAACFLLFSFMATAASFLSLAATAAGLGIQNPDFPKKGIYYLGGITEGAETIGLFIFICLWPQFFAEAAIIFACLCLITASLRLYWARKILRDH